MAILDLSPIVLTPGAGDRIDLHSLGDFSNPLCEIKLQNESPLTLTVSIGADTHRLGAFMQDVFPLKCQTFVDVSASAGAALPTPSTGDQLLVTVAQGGDTIPGTFPAPMVRAAGVINGLNTKITSNRPPQLLGSAFDSPANPQTTNFVIPSDVQALVIALPQALAGYVHLKVAWHPIAAPSFYVPLELFSFTQQLYAIPLTPSSLDGISNFTNSIDVTLQGTALGNVGVQVWALFEANPLWLEVFPLPQLEPNQLPKFVDPGPIPKLQAGAANAVWLIPAAANIQIDLFEIAMNYVTFGAAHITQGLIIGHSAGLPQSPPGPGPTQPQILIWKLDGTVYTYLFHGAQLPRGDGIWAWNNDTGDVVDPGVVLNYSLA